MEKQPPHVPLLSNRTAAGIIRDALGHGGDEVTIAAIAVRDFYEAKITSGELRVVTPVKLVGIAEECSLCDHSGIPSHYACCPGCGNPIERG